MSENTVLRRPAPLRVPVIDLPLWHEPNPVPSPHQQVGAAMRRVESVLCERMHWNAQFYPGGSHVRAYAGPKHVVVAAAVHEELLVALRLLAWELEELCND
jgi:hypothetical protein